MFPWESPDSWAEYEGVDKWCHRRRKKVQHKNFYEKAKKNLHFENYKFDFIFSVDFAGQTNAANSGICCRTEDVALVARH